MFSHVGIRRTGVGSSTLARCSELCEISLAASRRYQGERGSAGARVVVIQDELVLPLQPRSSDTPRNFDWGVPGGSARELAWSVLFDAAHEEAVAHDWFVEFTTDVVARLPSDSFRLTSSEVLEWLSDEQPTQSGRRNWPERDGSPDIPPAELC